MQAPRQRRKKMIMGGQPFFVQDGKDGCLDFVGFINHEPRTPPLNMPRIWVNNCSVSLRLLVYEDAYGPVQNGKIITSACNNPLCLNPKHLIAVTNSEMGMLARTKDKKAFLALRFGIDTQGRKITDPPQPKKQSGNPISHSPCETTKQGCIIPLAQAFPEGASSLAYSQEIYERDHGPIPAGHRLASICGCYCANPDHNIPLPCDICATFSSGSAEDRVRIGHKLLLDPTLRPGQRIALSKFVLRHTRKDTGPLLLDLGNKTTLPCYWEGNCLMVGSEKNPVPSVPGETNPLVQKLATNGYRALFGDYSEDTTLVRLCSNQNCINPFHYLAIPLAEAADIANFVGHPDHEIHVDGIPLPYLAQCLGAIDLVRLSTSAYRLPLRKEPRLRLVCGTITFHKKEVAAGKIGPVEEPATACVTEARQAPAARKEVSFEEAIPAFRRHEPGILIIPKAEETSGQEAKNGQVSMDMVVTWDEAGGEFVAAFPGVVEARRGSRGAAVEALEQLVREIQALQF